MKPKAQISKNRWRVEYYFMIRGYGVFLLNFEL
jgi:hypothetical protein